MQIKGGLLKTSPESEGIIKLCKLGVMQKLLKRKTQKKMGILIRIPRKIIQRVGLNKLISIACKHSSLYKMSQ